MKTKSKWKGAILATLALVLALSLAVVGAGTKAEALDNKWSPAEGILNIGLPAGAGALIDVAVVPGTDTVFVLCDQGNPIPGLNSVAVYRSDDAGLSWMVPVNLGLFAPAGLGVLVTSGVTESEVGVAMEVSPSYSQDSTVFLLTVDTLGTGYVYTSTDKGVTWGLAGTTTAALPAPPNCLAVDPTFNSLLSGGTIAVGTRWSGAASVFYETWQSPVLGWSGGWTAVASTAPDTPDTLALMYAPTSSLRLIAVQYDAWTGNVYGLTGSIATGFAAYAAGLPAPGVTNDGAAPLYFEGAQATINAEIAIGSDYDPVSSPACPNCPMYFFVATNDGGGPNGSTYFFDATINAFADLKAASTLPAAHMDTSGLLAQGTYARAELLTGCANVPITYNIDVRTMVWSVPTFIEGNGGPIGNASGNVGVMLEAGSTTYAITTQVPASAYPAPLGSLPVQTPGDLTCLSTSTDFGGSWADTCLTQEPFINSVVDMAWYDTGMGFQQGLVVCDDMAGQQSVFKSPAPTQWKRVDRWQGIQRITVSSDYEPMTGLGAIMLLDTGTTGGKVLRSMDDGESFTATAADPTGIVTIMMTCFAAGTADDIFVGDWNGHIYATHDGGATWADMGQVAGRVKSLDVPKFYATVQHVIAGVDTLTTLYQDVLVSKDDGVTWSDPGIALWGPMGQGLGGHIEAKFSPTYTGVAGADNFAYAGLKGTMAGDGMWRMDLSANPAANMFTDMDVGGIGAPTPISNFDIIHYPGINSESGRDNILYAVDGTVTAPGPPPTVANGKVYVTYDPETASALNKVWREDTLALPTVGVNATGNDVMGQGGVAPPAQYDSAGRDVTGPAPGNTLIPCPMNVVKMALSFPYEYEPGQFITITLNWATIIARDVTRLPAVGVNWDIVWSINETGAFLTPIVMNLPADGALVPSNNLSTGEPVELQWPAVDGAVDYDVQVVTDMANPDTLLINATRFNATELSIPLGTLADGETYYWRTRVATTWGGGGQGEHTGPWSAWMSFTVGYQEQAAPATLALVSPEVGGTGVPLRPNFAWTIVTETGSEEVTGYELIVATDAAFTEDNILIQESLGTQQTFAYPEDLDYNTTYHWRVQASGVIGTTVWTTPWAEGVFTTMAEVIEPTPPPQPTPQPPVIIEEVEDETPAWVWVLIAIGAVLAIAVIVLIMRTRRPA